MVRSLYPSPSIHSINHLAYNRDYSSTFWSFESVTQGFPRIGPINCRCYSLVEIDEFAVQIFREPLAAMQEKHCVVAKTDDTLSFDE